MAKPYHQPLVINGRPYDLAHLEPVTFSTPSEKLGRPVVTWCRFTTHTFTRSPTDAGDGPVVMDEGRRPRVFCPDRYALSIHLPGTIRQLTDPRRYVWETAAERNWLYRAEVEVVLGAAIVTYQVFFAVKKADRSMPYDVEMTVESAYALDPKRAPKLRGRAMIVGLLTATVEGRKLHTAGGGRNR